MNLIISLQVYVAGSNAYGNLGLGLDPTVNLSLSKLAHNAKLSKYGFSKIYAGESHSLAIDANGTLYAWGDNRYGQLGDSSLASRNAPAPVAFFTQNKIKARSASAGSSFSIVVSDEGNVYTFGSNLNLTLGRDVAESQDYDATPGLIDPINLNDGIDSDNTIIDAQASAYSALLITKSGNLYYWGMCEDSLCPEGGIYDNYNYPFRSDTFYSVAKIFVTPHSAFFENSDGRLFSFGQNTKGQLCVDTDAGLSSDPPPAGECAFCYTSEPEETPYSNVQFISGAAEHTVIVTAGKVYGCGSNEYGQRGSNPIRGYNPVPAELSGFSGTVLDIATTERGTLVLTDTDLYAAGQDQVGELSFGAGDVITDIFSPITRPDPFELKNKLAAHTKAMFLYTANEVINPDEPDEPDKPDPTPDPDPTPGPEPEPEPTPEPEEPGAPPVEPPTASNNIVIICSCVVGSIIISMVIIAVFSRKKLAFQDGTESFQY